MSYVYVTPKPGRGSGNASELFPLPLGAAVCRCYAVVHCRPAALRISAADGFSASSEFQLALFSALAASDRREAGQEVI